MAAKHDYDTGYDCLIYEAYQEALYYFHTAAEKGHLIAQLWLEQLYTQGMYAISFLAISTATHFFPRTIDSFGCKNSLTLTETVC